MQRDAYVSASMKDDRRNHALSGDKDRGDHPERNPYGVFKGRSLVDVRAEYPIGVSDCGSRSTRNDQLQITLVRPGIASAQLECVAK